MGANDVITLPPNYATVIVGLSYHQAPGIAYAKVKFAGRTFVADDEAVQIHARGDEIVVPRVWFWNLFAPVSPDTVGFSFSNAPVTHDPANPEPTTYFLQEVSPLVALLFEAVADAAHQHSEYNQLRAQALQALGDLQALGLIQTVLNANQYRGRIDGFKWPFVVIAVEPVHALRLGGETRILAVNTEVQGFDVNDMDWHLRKPVVFELGALVEGQRRAVNVTVVA